MSYAKKTRGYRRIAVDGQTYRWRYDTDTHECLLTLQHGLHSGQQAFVAISDISDHWLAFSEGVLKVAVVTPRMIPPLIRRALAQGWQPSENESPIRIEVRWEDVSLHRAS